MKIIILVVAACILSYFLGTMQPVNTTPAVIEQTAQDSTTDPRLTEVNLWELRCNQYVFTHSGDSGTLQDDRGNFIGKIALTDTAQEFANLIILNNQ